MGEAVLQVGELDVWFGPLQAVRKLSFALQPGEVVGLVGPNGAGKSTTLLTIMGMNQPTSGSVRLGDRELVGLSPETIAQLGIALVPEGRRIYAEFTVAENLRLGTFGRRQADGLEADLAWVNSLFPIVDEFRDRPAGQLSGGQQQQLAIARALIARPQILLLDEPSLGLAPTIVDGLFDALAEIRKRGVTILMVEQRAQLTAEFADRSLVMRGGEIVLTLAGDEPLDPAQIASAYFGA
ncbi:MAG: ABC transporter ATP-binding protein [Acidimicrobiia bacterium]|nr:ABC transporter ATP-binding protein [Acidimicrobiia bacterium]NNF09639.1 ABC transporter ATP-binding protein [Acidimicrobiia bacterium]NNL71720.1 ABC transporter ATP-binding protein [Acidimicrobiia bacterium]